MIGFLISVGVLIFAAIAVFKLVFLPMMFRVVTPTNEVHVVQAVKTTTAYGQGLKDGNVYYSWPAWVPQFGVRVTKLPISVFPQNLNDYPGYDKGRVPFILDVIGFFRIDNYIVAAQRVSNMETLKQQLDGILKGVIRAILATSEIETILEGRSEFSKQFTDAVNDQLKEWGCGTVKALELMDIRDAAGSQVIANIMAKKKSKVEMESRTEVAANMQRAQIAEIEAARAVAIQKQEAEELVGKRTAERNQAIGIAQQQADQAVKVEEAATAERAQAVIRVNRVKQAEIERDAQVVAADQARQVRVIEAEAEQRQQVIAAEAAKQVRITAADGAKLSQITEAEGTKQRTVLIADGDLEAAKRKAEGERAIGEAEGAAETARRMAPVAAQVALADKIAQSDAYQSYLVSIRRIESEQAIGIAQAAALEKAGVKIIANTGASPIEGFKSVTELFTPKGATTIGAALEALKQTDEGASLLAGLAKRLNGGGEAKP